MTSEVLTWIWIVSGLVCLPFNSNKCFNHILENSSWDSDSLHGLRAMFWIVQIVWNLIFCFICFTADFTSAVHDKLTTKISYIAHRESGSDGSGWWEWEFYRNGQPLSEYADDATPFQKDYKTYNSGWHSSELADIDNMSEPQLKAYIDDYNQKHTPNSLALGTVLFQIFGGIAFAVFVAPFWIMAVEWVLDLIAADPRTFLIYCGLPLLAYMLFLGWSSRHTSRSS